MKLWNVSKITKYLFIWASPVRMLDIMIYLIRIVNDAEVLLLKSRIFSNCYKSVVERF